ncbi:N-acetylmuramoyl-L-alanine amidase family protein [Butyrivibrio sp. YAB3001]|uniref:N-acetylmuramoyl-L-alanine amidase family protein n=1 Tax=Butyrivibrio sp. YAB3001 TaxID=1520812 RepID=UPI0008F6211C|nr:N-acetylmuramoyl-L-alanine amidase [Butyrivibrio sp. YAB3001]SFB67577.1 N-acetylmuramoyl-L-alanine amidase [Butyrivibrio sp. YAB3001]
MRKKLFSVCILIAIIFCSLFSYNVTSYAAKDNVVIVIDPGHGGTGDRNLGAVYNGFTEKDLTYKVAVAMKDELEKYDNVTVYLTRSADTFLSLEDRAKFAKSVNADFCYSIHFNASAEHDFYGSEVWTSCTGKYYQQGYDFGIIESDELASLGLYQKGVKSKVGKTGDDYYGIIRHCVARSIPCDIIEHCYLDHIVDVQKINETDFLQKLGVCDATAVAKYFKLKSSKTGTDYSTFSYVSVKKPSGKVHQDSSEPEICDIKTLAYDPESRNVLVEMTAKDSGSPIIYFSYSYDGGATFSPLQMWNREEKTQSFNIKIPNGVSNANIVCRAYNNFELYKQSNEVNIETR